MISQILSWPIRRHLIILILLLALPSILLIFNSGMEARKRAIDRAKGDTLSLVQTIATEEQNVVAGAQQLVTTLAILPSVLTHNSEVMNTLLSELIKKNPQYNNIAVTEKSGIVWASGVPIKGQVSLAGRRYFQEAVRTGMFSSGEYAIGKIVHTTHLGFGYPVKNSAGEIIAVIALTLNINNTQKTFDNLKLPPGSTFSLLDHQGLILLSNKDVSDKLVGKRDIHEDLFTTMAEGSDEGTWEAMGNDDQMQLIAYKRISLPYESKPYLYVRSSIPLGSAMSHANTAMLKNLAVFTMIFLFAISLALFIGDRMILRPVTILKKASEQLGDGADTINVSHLVKGGELGELARAFDGMADTLVQKGMDLRESEQKYRSVVENSMDAILITKEDGTILSANSAACRILGMSEEEIIERKFTGIVDLADPQYEKAKEERARTGQTRSEFNLIRKDGSRFTAEVASSFYNSQGNVLASVMFRDITERKQAEKALQNYKDELENKVQERTAQLAEMNKSLLVEIEERKRTENRLRSAQKNLRAMSAEIVVAEERSRQHFAADLHDTVIQTLGAAKLRGQLIQDDIPAKISSEFQELQNFVSQAVTQSRFIMTEMSPPVLNELGFIPAIEWLAEQIEAQYRINIEVNAENGFTPLQHDIEVLLFQATRELLMNVVKHAGACKALVKVSGGNRKIRIEVMDDGRGFDKRQAFRTDVSSGGFGLFSIRERIRHFGGHLIIQSEEGNGTRVVLTAPRTSGWERSHNLKK